MSKLADFDTNHVSEPKFDLFLAGLYGEDNGICLAVITCEAMMKGKLFVFTMLIFQTIMENLRACLIQRFRGERWALAYRAAL